MFIFKFIFVLIDQSMVNVCNFSNVGGMLYLLFIIILLYI